MAIFDPPPHSSETTQLIFMITEIYNYLPDMTGHAKFQGDDVGGLGKYPVCQISVKVTRCSVYQM